MSRVAIYIDGFNFYHAIMRDRNLRPYRWVDFDALGRSILSSKESLERVYFFTAFYPGRPDKEARHKVFLRAQRTKQVEVVLGTFRRKEKYCKSCKITSIGYEEKESDVNIAVHVVRDAFRDVYDTAMLLSNDSDLIPAIRAVKEDFPNKTVKMLFPPGGASNSLKLEADSYMRLKLKHVRDNQFPNSIAAGNATIEKPREW